MSSLPPEAFQDAEEIDFVEDKEYSIENFD